MEKDAKAKAELIPDKLIKQWNGVTIMTTKNRNSIFVLWFVLCFTLGRRKCVIEKEPCSLGALFIPDFTPVAQDSQILFLPQNLPDVFVFLELHIRDWKSNVQGRCCR